MYNSESESQNGRPVRASLAGIGAVALLLAAAPGRPVQAQAAGQPLAVLEPAKTSPAVPRKPERARWSWNQAQAGITPAGDLVWQPRPFRFEAGKSVRYIDFEAGRDDNPGTSRAAPWKHHPWDPAATGAAKAADGIQTYVFKRGVIYRGTLQLHNAAGTAGNPIRLTSDPSWGKGEAIISGAERVTGWHRGADRADIPEAGTVWWADMPFAPRNLWVVRPEGIERIALARTPNWKVSDPDDVMSEWLTWEQPSWWTNANKIAFQDHRAHIGIDSKHLTQPADYYVGADVRTEFGIVMGTPFPSRVEAYDPGKKGIIFQGIWFGDSEQLMTGNRYYLEDKPQYLDSPGEFWFDKKDDGGRLYVRLPGDSDPNRSVVEAGRQINLLESDGLSHVAITGLTFRFTNTYWDLTQPGWGNKDVDNAAVRVLGRAQDVRIANCRFEHVGKAIRISANTPGLPLDQVVIADNDIEHIDHGAIDIQAAGQGDVQVLRNRLLDIGGRPSRQDMGHALVVGFPETMEVAGNMLDRCYGSGIFLFGGKGSGEMRDAPLSRMLVHGNRAVDTLLSANDWGGIETWQGGPAYVYNNISGNPVGFWNWAYAPGKGNARLGYAYYHDGGFKVYDFNDVAWGKSSDPTSKLCSAAAINEATPTIENTFFNNTYYDFAQGSNWSPAGGRHLMLGNAWVNIPIMVFQYGQLKEDTEPAPAQYEEASAGIGRNVFGGVLPSKTFALFETSGKGYADPQSLRAAMTGRHTLIGDVGDVTNKPLMRDPEHHDFRPLPGSALIDHGVKVFVPWSLARTVGEWNFRRNNDDPTVLLDDHWYMAPYYTAREDYYRAPRFPLKAINVSAGDFVRGPLEDWTEGALAFSGDGQYAVLTHADMTKPYSYQAAVDGKAVTQTAAGADLATPDIGTTNLLIEVYFRTRPGHAGSVLVAKRTADTGYQLAINRAGGTTLTLKAGGQTAELASGALVDDGRWHHLIAEVDRAFSFGTIYTDGNTTAHDRLVLPAGASLSNTGDLLVGKGPDGHFFAGAIDFLRIARSTLAESKTSIAELYDWEFDGPFLRDFAGHEVTGKARDAGAFEMVNR